MCNCQKRVGSLRCTNVNIKEGASLIKTLFKQCGPNLSPPVQFPGPSKRAGIWITFLGGERERQRGRDRDKDRERETERERERDKERERDRDREVTNE